MTLDLARALDAADPFASTRRRFTLPAGIIYLDGNSLGALPKDAPARVADVVERQWGEDLITSWNKHGWIDWPHRIAAKLGPLLNASPDELLIADSTSVCLFKLIVAAFRARPGRSVIVTETTNFPTDAYIMQGIAALLPDAELRVVERDTLPQAIDADTAVVSLTHVDYRGGQRLDMAAINRAAGQAGALAVWDLSHSTGVLAIDVDAAGCELAVGCGYKYLNGGPGAPAFLYVARGLQEELQSPLTGWFGHAEPFAFAGDYRPASDIRKFLTGTPSVLALAALDAGLDTFAGVDLQLLQEKTEALTGFFIDAVTDRCGFDLSTQRDRGRHGGHVIMPHDQGYAVVRALIERGVVGDFRAPNLMRFGFAPLYNSFEDAWRAAEIIADVLRTAAWKAPRFANRERVT